MLLLEMTFLNTLRAVSADATKDRTWLVHYL